MGLADYYHCWYVKWKFSTALEILKIFVFNYHLFNVNWDQSRRKSIFEIVSKYYNLANGISSSFSLKTQVRVFYKKTSANCFEDPAVFSFIFLYDCFRPKIKQKFVWSSFSFVNNSYKLIIILITSKQIIKRIHAFSISNTFITNTRLKLANN